MSDRHRDMPPAHPLQRADDPPPPRREQLPLPQREEQSHLAPQLRTPGGAGSGTPFLPFGAEVPGRPTPPRGPGRIAAFHAATRRRRAHNHRAQNQHTGNGNGAS